MSRARGSGSRMPLGTGRRLAALRVALRCMPEPIASDETPDRLAERLASLRVWPGGAGPAEWIQTHISHVFLVGERVYKLRKAVAFPFLDFTERAARNDDCLREVALNRRLAPSVYLGVAPIRCEAGEVTVGPLGESLAGDAEHATVMRRLPAGRDALSLLERGELTAGHVAAIAARLPPFHDAHTLGSPAPWDAERWLARIAEPVRECFVVLGEGDCMEAARVAAAAAQAEAALAAGAPHFERRRSDGRAVDAHGDLHLDHVWFEDDGDEPLLVDCLEFSEDLRRIDRASELAFLQMDLAYRGRADLGEFLLADYAGRTDDFGLFRVVDFFAAYRALVRAKVAALATGQATLSAAQRGDARASAVRHLELAESLLEPRSEGAIVLLCGTVGSGKSTVARRMAEAGQGVPVASDRVRKRLAGLEPTARTGAGVDEGLYHPEQTRRVYEALFERAEDLVASGRTALLDASFTTRSQRAMARAWAEQRGVRARLIEVRCELEQARQRLEARARAGKDPSDAGPDFLATSLARFEPPEEWPVGDREVVRTDDAASMR